MRARLTEVQTQQFIQHGFVAVRGLLPRETVAATREAVLAALGIDVHDPATWEGEALSADPAIIAPCPVKQTNACLTVSP